MYPYPRQKKTMSIPFEFLNLTQHKYILNNMSEKKKKKSSDKPKKSKAPKEGKPATPDLKDASGSVDFEAGVLFNRCVTKLHFAG
jgi:hypothetical protein